MDRGAGRGQRARARAPARLIHDAAAAGDGGGPAALPPAFAEFRPRFERAMDDDFNTPQALGVLFDFGRALSEARDRGAGGPGAFVAGVDELVRLARGARALRPRRGRRTAAPARSPAAARRAGRGAAAPRLQAQRRAARRDRTARLARRGHAGRPAAGSGRGGTERGPRLGPTSGARAAPRRRPPGGRDRRPRGRARSPRRGGGPGPPRGREGLVPHARPADGHGGLRPAPGRGGARRVRGVRRTSAALLDVPAARGEPAFFLALDQVQDPRNFGALLQDGRGLRRPRRRRPQAPRRRPHGRGGPRPRWGPSSTSRGARDQLVSRWKRSRNLGIWVYGARRDGGAGVGGGPDGPALPGPRGARARAFGPWSRRRAMGF